MENNINKKNNSINMMKKIISIFTLLFISLTMSNVYGQVLYEDNQTIVEENYNSASIIGASTPDLIFNGGSDITENFQLSTTPLYVLLSASGINDSETISISYYNSITEQFQTNDYTIPKQGTFYIELTPQDVGDKTSLILHNATGTIFYSYVFVHDELRGETTTIYEPLIQGVVDLVDINITIWKAGYYLIIFLVSVSLIIGIFASAFWVIDKTKKLNNEGTSSENHKRD